jgi:L-ascorbate metabolism protein UlaG (beta-lactamase superfamily)
MTRTPGTGDSLSFVGTATTLLRLGRFTILTDPNFLHQGQWSYFGQGLFSRRRTEPAMQPAELPALAAVVLSHLHGDHFDQVACRELPRDLPIVTTPDAAGRLRRRGFGESVPLGTWSSTTFSDGDSTLRVTSVPARHTRGPLNRLLPPVMGSVVEYRATSDALPRRIYLSGDTILYDGLDSIRDRFPALDLAVVHLGGTRVLGVLLSMDHRQGVDLLELLEPDQAVPVHFDDYGLFTSPVSNFMAEVRHRDPRTRVHLLQRGETLSL